MFATLCEFVYVETKFKSD